MVAGGYLDPIVSHGADRVGGPKPIAINSGFECTYHGVRIGNLPPAVKDGAVAVVIGQHSLAVRIPLARRRLGGGSAAGDWSAGRPNLRE